jgi:hypothetical protein
MKISPYPLVLLFGIVSARRSVPVPSNNVHRMGKFEVLRTTQRRTDLNFDRSSLICQSYCVLIVRAIFSGWGLDDDVFFSEPQDVSTFRSESKTIKELKPVNRVVKTATDSKPARKVRKMNPWRLPRVDNFQDFIGIE